MPGSGSQPPPNIADGVDGEVHLTLDWQGGAGKPSAGGGRGDETEEIRALLAPGLDPGDLGYLGPYRILKVVGIGGMGVVFQAQDPVLVRKVAVKGMLPSVAAKAANRERFLREARATAALNHEHIVTVYNVGEDRGLPFLVMEFLEGESLEERLVRESRLPLNDVLRIGLETARGLAAAHATGLVHRDVKPPNIWLESDRGRVKILDFGLARATADNTNLTLSGIILGTPAYMAPEQARGLSVDARADLFSLGTVLYRMLSGELPFKGSDTLAILTALAVETPRPIHYLRADIPQSLANLVMSLLAKSAGDRPPSAQAVCATLETIRRDQEGGDLFNFNPTEILLDGEADEEIVELEVVSEPEELPYLMPGEMAGLVGHVLGRYALEDILGWGQHGTVFRARDQDNGQFLALKVLSPVFPKNDAEIQRFGNVLTQRMTLDHPNLVTVFNAGRTAPYCWIAQELVEGESLASVIAGLDTGSHWDWKRAFRVAIQMGRVLQYTSARRILHSNITPQNILLQRSDDTFKLNDVMFAKVVEKSHLYRITLDQKLDAEVAYLSPEQADGGTSFIDHLCDMYSLGVVLYVLVTGRPPFQGETTEETLGLIREGAPIHPRKYQRTIPREFEWTILKMIARRQENRYQSPTELVNELNRIAILHRITT